MREYQAAETLPPVVPFDHPYASAPATLVARLGGKGAYLAEMTGLGLPVPPGFTLTTDLSADILDRGDFAAVEPLVAVALARLEAQTGRRFGDPVNPLLLSVRSGAPASMPGMMDTVLNIGATPATVAALATQTGDAGFAWNCYARLAAMFARIVLDVDVPVEAITGRIADDHASLGDRVAALDAALADRAALPADPRAQLLTAIGAVIASWNSDRARAYRAIEHVPDRPCTGVTVQAMVFGNLGRDSGSGVAFTRDPATGAPGLVGDWLACAQGEDVVAGTHRPGTLADLRADAPQAAAELARIAPLLERHLGDMCDIEFTVERGRMWLLQVRAGKRSPRAALRIAVDLAGDPDFPLDRAGAVRRTAKLLRNPPSDTPPLETLVSPERLVAGVGASPGIGIGRACFDPDMAVDSAERGEPVVLVRCETSPADVHGMAKAAAIVTATGGAMSHAAVVARGWGIPAVVGVEALHFGDGGVTLAGVPLAAGDWLTVDGSTGRIALERIAYDVKPLPELATLCAWRDAAEFAEAAPPGASVTLADPAAAALILLSIKGTVSDGDLATAMMTGVEALVPTLNALSEGGDLVVVKRGRRPGEAGAGRAGTLIAAQGTALGAMRLEPFMARFDSVNGAFKAAVTARQTDAQDGDERAFLATLRAIHADLLAVIAHLLPEADLVPLFVARLERALAEMAAGNSQWFLSLRVDSYHSVWFELHEYLIRLSGRNRADEAAAGRAH